MSTNIGGPTFVSGLIHSDNRLISASASMFIVFAPLYLFSSMGYNWPWFIALLIGALFLLRTVGEPLAKGYKGGFF